MEHIPGLTVIENFVSPDEEVTLVASCDGRLWSGLGIRYI